MTTALHAVPASTNVPQAQSQRAKSTLSTPTYVLTAALAQTFAPQVQSLRANNSSAHVNLTQKGCFASFLPQSGGRTQSSSFLFVSSSKEEHPMQRHVPAAWGVRGFGEGKSEVALALLLLHRSLLIKVDYACCAFALCGGHHFLHNLLDGVGLALDSSRERPASEGAEAYLAHFDAAAVFFGQAVVVGHDEPLWTRAL